MTLWSIHAKTIIDPDLLALADGDSLIARILLNRGVSTVEAARYYLDTKNIRASSSLEIPEMAKAYSRIKTAIDKQEKILIYGDYDVDGTSSVALLYRAFAMIGVQVDYYIPDRHSEGYGINKEALKKIKEELKTDLIISCDCGISNYEEVKYGQSIGLDIIVTDHHSIPNIPPPGIANCNPKTLPKEHPLHFLPGVGVAYKLAELILDEHFDQARARAYAHSLLDLVALGIIADLAPLRAENRYLTVIGLEVLAKTKKIGLQELLKVSSRGADTESIGFGLAPRINAAGRLADATRAVRLMITEDRDEAIELCRDLDDENKNRQELCNEIQEDALTIIDQDRTMLEDNVIVLANEGWHHGVIGIVASRLLDKFHLPVFIMAIDGDKARGSVRCIDIPGLDIYQEMKTIQEKYNLFLGYGGHKMAAGFSVKAENTAKLCTFIREHFRVLLADNNIEKNIMIDTALRLNEVNTKLITRLERLVPYGVEHRQALFISGPLKIEAKRDLGKDGKHLKLFLSEEGNKKKYEAVLWNRAQEFTQTYQKNTITIVYSPRINEFMGDKIMQLDIKDWKDPSDVGEEFFVRFKDRGEIKAG